MFKNNFQPFAFALALTIFALLNFYCSDCLADEKISGRMQKLDNYKVIINNDIYNAQNALIIFQDQQSSQVINFEEIPNNINVLCYTDDINIKKIIISGSKKYVAAIKPTLIYEFAEEILDFEISYDGNYLAYFNWNENRLKVINLKEKQLIWQIPLTNPNFSWNLKNNSLAFSNVVEKFISLNIFNPNKNKVNTILKIDTDSPSFINYLNWSPDGEKIAYTILEGLNNSHGYISSLKITDKSGVKEKSYSISDINYFTWSSSGRYLAFNQFLNTDIATSRIGIYDFQNDKITYLNNSQAQINPIFSPNEKNLIYTDLSGIRQNINMFKISDQSQVLISEEVKYIDDFGWLDDNTLVYTFGNLPQIKLFDFKNQEGMIVSAGFAPKVSQNTLYFLKKSRESKLTRLYLYRKPLNF